MKHLSFKNAVKAFSPKKMNPSNVFASSGISGTTSNQRGVILLTMTLLIFLFSANVGRANTIVPLSVTPCSDEALTDVCTSWGEWYPESRWIKFQFTYRRPWPLPPVTLTCNANVFYAWRACTSNHMLRQYDIKAIDIPLNYKVWIFPIGWKWPCRDAFKMLTGTKKEVSERLNNLYANVTEALLLNNWKVVFEDLDKAWPGHTSYSCANGAVPIIIASSATCKASCAVYNLQFPISIGEVAFNESIIPLQFLADEYNNGDTNGIIIAPLGTEDILELNQYVAAEVNPYILEITSKVPEFPLSGSGPRVTFVPIPCGDTPDFCCIDKFTVCRDYTKPGKPIVITPSVETTGIPQECIDGTLPSTIPNICFRGEYPPVVSKCAENCTKPEQPQSATSVVETVIISSVSPNPTTNGTTLTLEVLTAGILNIKLVNVEGRELMELHNAHTEVGEFTKNFTMSNLPQGVYYLRISHNGNVKMEKVIRN